MNEARIEKMVEQIEQGNFATAMEIHMDWINKDFWSASDGIEKVEAATGKRAYGEYNRYFFANL